MLLYLLLVSLMLLFYYSYIMSDMDILAAPNTLCIGFIIAVIVSIINMDMWDFDMSIESFLIIIVGIVTFMITYYVVILFMKKTNKANVKEINWSNISLNKTGIFLIMQVVVFMCNYIYILEVADFFNVGETLFEKITEVRILKMFCDIDSIPGLPQQQWIIGKLNVFCTIGTLFYIFNIVKNKIFNQKVPCVYYLVIIVYAMTSILSGGRYGIIVMLMAGIVYHHMILLINNDWYRSINIYKTILSIVIGLSIFVSFTFLVGRQLIDNLNFYNIIDTVWKQLSTYMGAELKLLDIYVSHEYNRLPDEFFGVNTFPFFFKKIGIMLNNEWQFINIGGLPFHEVNGMSLGNVYTMFMPFYADGGLFGVVLFSSIMASFFAYMYSRIKYIKCVNNGVNYTLLIYGYYYYSAPFAFYAGWFYTFINFNTIWEIACFWLFPYFFVDNQHIEKSLPKQG